MEFIDEVEAKGSTCGKCGIKESFRDISRHPQIYGISYQNTAGCSRIITFLTDGKMNDASWSNWESWLNSQKQSLSGSNPHIFTYALGARCGRGHSKKIGM